MENILSERERLIKLMESEGVNAKAFAEKVGIQPATMSNIMNGRNKPSLEVLQRVLNAYRMVDTDWLILGSGSMYRQKSHSQELTLFDVRPETREESVVYTEKVMENSAEYSSARKKNMEEMAETPKRNPIDEPKKKEVTKVVVFYSDGTFDEIAR